MNHGDDDDEEDEDDDDDDDRKTYQSSSLTTTCTCEIETESTSLGHLASDQGRKSFPVEAGTGGSVRVPVVQTMLQGKRKANLTTRTSTYVRVVCFAKCQEQLR